jgi:hypothetical protein
MYYEILSTFLFSLAVPPHQLTIYDNSGREVNPPVTDPLTEGSDLILTCEVRGGKSHIHFDGSLLSLYVQINHIIAEQTMDVSVCFSHNRLYSRDSFS